SSCAILRPGGAVCEYPGVKLNAMDQQLNTTSRKPVVTDQKPHWLITELAAICIVCIALYIGYLWQSANSLEGLKSSAAYHFQRNDYDQAIAVYQKLIAMSESSKRPENKEFAGMLA